MNTEEQEIPPPRKVVVKVSALSIREAAQELVDHFTQFYEKYVTKGTVSVSTPVHMIRQLRLALETEDLKNEAKKAEAALHHPGK